MELEVRVYMTRNNHDRKYIQQSKWQYQYPFHITPFFHTRRRRGHQSRCSGKFGFPLFCNCSILY